MSEGISIAIQAGSFIYNKWKEKQKEIESNIDLYLKAAAKDNVISNVDGVFLKPRVLNLVKSASNINKYFEKMKLDLLMDQCTDYIKLIGEIETKIPFEHLSKILSLASEIEIDGIGKIENASEFLKKLKPYCF